MIFLWAFLPIVFILDKIAGKSRKLQNLILLAASLVFYAWGEPRYMWLLLVSILANYVLGLVMDKTQTVGARRTALILGILANLGILGYYKYFNFFINTLNKVAGRELLSMKDIALPLGVSFFTFQAMSYLIDLYKKKYGAQKNILNMALYFAFFPKITQGPIEKYRDFEKQLTERKQSLSLMGEGIRRFVYGLAKKVIIADALGSCVDRIYGLDLANVNGVLAWIAIIFYSLQLYYDFSGYSDMALGLGRMFGFHFPENFHYPYESKSITEFWRRWHISLGTWFKEYVYFPLGGSRCKKAGQLRNILIVWLLTGIWHGAGWNFLLWGLYFAAFLLLEKFFLKERLEKCPAFIRWLYAMLAVFMGWVLFAFDDMQAGLLYFRQLFGAAGLSLVNERTLYILFTNLILMAAAAIGATSLPIAFCREHIQKKSLPILEPIFVAAVLLVSTAFLVNAGYNPFLYFRF